ncbi:MAG TPA: nuclear transport factor 2 family protein [Parafilimonas sp.]|nr:nuclear transport factor 2 family protein [Parafilimonas sp.]
MKSATFPVEMEPGLQEVSENVLSRHLNSFADNDLETLMSDYTDESVLITPDATYAGIKAIREFFVELIKHFPKGATSLDLDKLVIIDELIFITWHAKTPVVEVPFATDTFVVKKGKIFRQTFAGELKFLN